jgi:hypothetical protein
MAAPSKSWNTIIDGQVDADSPLDTTLMTAIRDNLVHLEEWLGGSHTAAVDHSHNGTDSALITDLGVNVVGSDSLSYTAGDVLVASSDSETYNRSDTYIVFTSAKKFTIARSGELRIKFALQKGGSLTSAQAKIHVNGSPVGTERSVTGSWTTFSEDISGLSAGDVVELYGKKVGGNWNTEIKEFRIYNEYPVVIS